MCFVIMGRPSAWCDSIGNCILGFVAYKEVLKFWYMYSIDVRSRRSAQTSNAVCDYHDRWPVRYHTFNPRSVGNISARIGDQRNTFSRASRTVRIVEKGEHILRIKDFCKEAEEIKNDLFYWAYYMGSEACRQCALVFVTENPSLTEFLDPVEITTIPKARTDWNDGSRVELTHCHKRANARQVEVVMYRKELREDGCSL